jgi:stage III sporulation protein AA
MTTHGKNLDDIKKRPSLRGILEQEIFQRFIVLSRRNGPGTIAQIVDGQGKELSQKVRVT